MGHRGAGSLGTTSIVSEPLGRVLGNRYRLVSALGTGASAHVFCAEDVVLQRRVAVKVLQPALVQDEAFLRRFRAEARSVAAMNHPHVLRVFDWGEDDDGPYLVLEYLEGGSLFEMLASGARLSPVQAARVGAEAAEGLAYAHARGIVHRDVKPANILFDEEGRVRVADFGVARALAGATLTEPAGTMLGTARYASPEQAQGSPLDGRSDVYSLGLVLYEAVTGAPAFEGDTPMAMLQARIGASVPHRAELGVISDLVASAAADHDERPDAATFAQRLDELVDRVGIAAPLPLARRPPLDGASTGVQAPAPGADGTVAVPAADGTVAVPAADRTAMALGAAGSGLGGVGDAALAGLGLTGDPTGELGTGGAGGRNGGERLQRRRWPWVVAVAVLVALLLAAGAAYAVKEKVFVPSHTVPAVVNDSLAQARRALAADHFTVKEDPAVHSTTVVAGSVVRQTPPSGTTLKEGSVVHVTPSSGLPQVAVPPLTGEANCTDVSRLLVGANLKSQCPAAQVYSATIPAGGVISWSYNGTTNPTNAPYGATIAVTVSKGHAPVAVPSVSRDTYTQAAATLQSAGLSAKEVQAYSTTVPAGQVISTTPGGGTTVGYGTTVTVTVSQGPHLVTVPTVKTMTVATATATLQKTGLKVGAVYGPTTSGTQGKPTKKAKVLFTLPSSGQQVKYGSTVALYTR